MYKITPTPYGLRIILSGEVDLELAEEFRDALSKIVCQFPVSFSALVDIRGIIRPGPEVVEVLRNCLEIGRQHRMTKIIVAYCSPIDGDRLRSLSTLGGTFDEARQIDASKFDNWEQVALNWIMNDVEPAEVYCSTGKIVIPT